MKPTIFFISKNNNKVQDLVTLFKSSNLDLVGYSLDLPEIQSLDQEEIVRRKGRTAWELVKSPILVDDTAFYINRYNNFPGTLTRFINESLGIRGLTKLIDEGDAGYFKTFLYFYDGNREIVAKGELAGKLTKNISTNFSEHSPLNSIFIPEGSETTIADSVSKAVLNRHRERAVNEFLKAYSRKGI